MSRASATAYPGSPPIPDRDCFTMGEACRIVQVAPHTLRYWEAKLGWPRPARRASGHRRYSRGDLDTALEIKRLLKGRGMTMAGARRALRERRRSAAGPGPGPAAPPAAMRLLREVRRELQALASELAK